MDEQENVVDGIKYITDYLHYMDNDHKYVTDKHS